MMDCYGHIHTHEHVATPRGTASCTPIRAYSVTVYCIYLLYIVVESPANYSFQKYRPLLGTRMNQGDASRTFQRHK
jgi:hypothetical protein